MRLSADWPLLQPDPRGRPKTPTVPARRSSPRSTSRSPRRTPTASRSCSSWYRFPLWANGLESLGAQRNTDAEICNGFADRISPAAWTAYVAAGRDPARVNPSRRALEFGLPPGGLGPDSAWAAFFAFCHDRWRLGRQASGPYVHGFELANHPNFQWWPQRAPATGDDPFATASLTAQVPMAQMMATAASVAAGADDGTLLFAPSFADSELGGRTVTQYDEFTTALLDALDAAGHAAGPREVWSHHNYTDLERRSVETKLQRMRGLMTGRWAGFSEGAQPTYSSPRAVCACPRWPPTTRARIAARPRR